MAMPGKSKSIKRFVSESNLKLDEHTSASRLWVLLALFILGIIGVLWGIGNGVNELVTKRPGYYEITVNPDDAVPYFRNGYTYITYLDGPSAVIKRQLSAVTLVYEQALKRSYQLLDETTEYPGFVNLATLNTHQGETLAVNPELFAILHDLQEKTREQQGVNMFSGALTGEWDAVLILADMSDFDPAGNADWNERITALAEKTSDLSLFSLELDPVHMTACFTVSGEYQSYLDSIECSYPILTAGRLKDAYRLQLIQQAVQAVQPVQGYLAAAGAMKLVLCDDSRNTVLKTGCDCDTAGYHQQGTNRYHPLFRLSDGSMPQLIDTCAVYDAGDDIVGSAYTAVNLFQCASREEIESIVQNSGKTVNVQRREF